MNLFFYDFLPVIPLYVPVSGKMHGNVSCH